MTDSPQRTSPETESDWQDDPAADERWQAGCDYAMMRLCDVLGVDMKSVRWDAATETLDGDVCAVLWNILVAKYGDGFDPYHTFHHAQTPAVTREAMEAFIDALSPVQQVYLDNGHVQATWNVRGLQFFTLNFTEAFATLSDTSTDRDAGWCQPMDCGKPTPRKFFLYFDDPDHGNAVFEDEAEARAAFERASTAWNCYLFGALPVSSTVGNSK